MSDRGKRRRKNRPRTRTKVKMVCPNWSEQATENQPVADVKARADELLKATDRIQAGTHVAAIPPAPPTT